MPWNVGDAAIDSRGIARASTAWRADDIRESRRLSVERVSVVYPGYG
ncbi:MAG: hypothetical protein P4L84_37605 [Isosphaeraceae bacterium]|nr:hypothetical protein [Isosphaeraceae bacterium]